MRHSHEHATGNTDSLHLPPTPMPATMKHLLLLLGFLSSIASHGQFKVKMEITGKGDTVYSTPEKRIYTVPGAKNSIGEIVKSSVYKSRAGVSLCLTIQTGRTSVFSISEGDAAELMLDDGSSLALRARGEYNSRRSALDYGCHLFAFYSLNGRALDKLRSQNIKKISVFASLGKMVYDIEGKPDVIRKQVSSFD